MGVPDLIAGESALLFERAADAILVVDGRGAIVSANAASGELLGLPADSLVGRSLQPFVDPGDHARYADHLSAAVGGAQRRLDCALVRLNGERRLVSLSFSPVAANGAGQRVLMIGRDVTEERLEATVLENAEARYARLIDAAEDAIATLDEEGHFTSVNLPLEKVTGLSRETLLGTHFSEHVPPDEQAGMWRLFTGTLAGARQSGNLPITWADGSQGTVIVRTAPIMEGGTVTGVLVIIRDVSEEHRLVEQVVRREKLAALGELVGGVAHEINTPLTGILAFSQLLLARGALNPEGQHAAESIANEAKRAARIIGKLLSFARQSPQERLPTDLNQVVRDSLELRRYSHRLQGISVSVELDPSLPITWADPSQLQQVFLNLLANAEQAVANAAGDRRITVRSRREGTHLVVAFGDSGRGIAPEHLPHIFNPFFTTKPRGIGTGLGLSISDGLIREHDGSLRVRSEPGQGALFEVFLPHLSPPLSTRA